jgi:hypothetical protein
MQIDDHFYDDETVSKIKNDLNTNYSTELAELVDMTFGPKPDAELQRLTSVEIIAIDSFGPRLLCNYHRWETAEKNDRMFHKHTDETTRIFTIPFSIQPHSKEELLSVIEKMINDAQTSYLKGFE